MDTDGKKSGEAGCWMLDGKVCAVRFLRFLDKGGGVAEKERDKPMARTYKPYNVTFRQQAVELLSTSGKTLREVAHDPGRCVETLQHWKQEQESEPEVVNRVQGCRRFLAEIGHNGGLMNQPSPCGPPCIES